MRTFFFRVSIAVIALSSLLACSKDDNTLLIDNIDGLHSYLGAITTMPAEYSAADVKSTVIFNKETKKAIFSIENFKFSDSMSPVNIVINGITYTSAKFSNNITGYPTEEYGLVFSLDSVIPIVNNSLSDEFLITDLSGVYYPYDEAFTFSITCQSKRICYTSGKRFTIN